MFLAYLSGDHGHHGVLAHLPRGPLFLKALPVQIFLGRVLGIWEGLDGLSSGIAILKLRNAVPLAKRWEQCLFVGSALDWTQDRCET